MKLGIEETVKRTKKKQHNVTRFTKLLLKARNISKI